MKYRYTLYKADGSSQELGEYKKEMTLEEKYKILDCNLIEYIPRDYFPDSDAKNDNVEYIGDEEGRFAEGAERNRHMKVLIDNRRNEWDVVGTLIRQEKISERASKSK